MAALALLRVIHIVVSVLSAAVSPTPGFLGSYLVGLPFGLSTCLACIPLLLPLVAAAAATADPLMGAVLMGTFGLARGAPILWPALRLGASHISGTRVRLRCEPNALEGP